MLATHPRHGKPSDIPLTSRGTLSVRIANAAQRWQSQQSGIPGRIRVTQRFYECLQGQGKFRFEERGVINAKGKGDMTVYLLEGSV